MLLALYVRELADLSERSVRFAFDEALKHCRFFPNIAELREFALAGAQHFQREEASRMLKEARAARLPDSSPKLDQVWAEISARHDQQERIDRQYVEKFTDEQVDKLIGPGGPFRCNFSSLGMGTYSEWRRRREARAGLRRPIQQIATALLGNVQIQAREPGWEEE